MKYFNVLKSVTNITSVLLITISSMGSALLIPQAALAEQVPPQVPLQVTPTSPNGWYARPSDLVTGGTVKYVVSAGAPLGTGALELGTSSSLDAVTHLTHPADIPLNRVTTLSYDTKQVATTDQRNGNATLRVSLNLHGGTTEDEQLMFEPYYNGFDGTIQTGWKTWDLIHGKFWSNFGKGYGSLGGNVGSGSYDTNFTLKDVLTAYPQARVIGLIVSMGSYNPSQQILIDNVKLNDTTYDFEPVIPDTAGPTITDPTVTNSALWGANYDILSKSNHLSESTGLPVVGGTIQIGANFNDDRLLTNIISYLPGRGFFADSEYAPIPVNNNSWTGVKPGRYAVNWDTKNGADWRKVGDGNYDFSFNARDGGNGQNGVQNNTYSTTRLTVDNTGPSVDFVSPTPTESSLVKGTITVNGSFTDANGLMNTDIGVHNDGRTGEGWICHADWPTQGIKTCPIDTTQLADGTYKLTMAGRDKAGNVTQVFRTIKVDNVAPTVPINLLPAKNGYEKTNDFYFSWDASIDTSFVTYEFQSSGNPTFDNNGSLINAWNSIKDGNSEQNNLTGPAIHSTGAPDGTYNWQVRAIDAAGNKSGWTLPIKMTIDTHAPVVSIAHPTFSTVTGHTLNIDGTATDDNFNYYYCYVTNANGEVGIRDSKCETAWSLGSLFHSAFAQTATGTPSGHLGSVDLTGLADGAYTAHLAAYDKAGNISETSTPFTLDNTAPVVTDTFNVTMLVGHELTLTPTVTGDTGVTYSWAVPSDSQLVKPPHAVFTNPTLTIGPAPKGEYFVTLTVTDPAGNATKVTYKVTINIPASNVLGAGTAKTIAATLANVTSPAVLGASIVALASEPVVTTTPAVTKPNIGNGQVKGDDTVNIKTAANNFNPLGLGWWWLPIVLGFLGIGWFMGASLRHKRSR